MGTSGHDGILNLNAFNQTISSLDSGGTTTVGIGQVNAGGTISGTLTINNGNSKTYTGSLPQAAGSVNLVKNGTGTQTLKSVKTGSNSGTTTINAGTLTLDYTTINTGSAKLGTGILTFGGGTLNLNGGTATESPASTTIAFGGSQLTDSSTGSKVALGGLTAQSGGTLNIGAATIATTTTTPGAASNPIGGYLTFGGTDWAITNGGTSPYPIIALPSGTYTTTFAAGNNVSISSSTSALSSSLSLNTLRMTAASTLTINDGNTLTLASGGLLISSAAGSAATAIAPSSSTGAMVGSSGGQLAVSHFGSGTLTISAVIANNGTATALAKSGSGNLTLTGADSYSGNTYVNAGTLALGTGGSINNSPNINVAAGATFDVSALSSYTMAAGQNLSGQGAVNGAVITGTGFLVPGGTNNVGTLTFNNNLTMASGSKVVLDVNNLAGGNDLVAVTGNLTVPSSYVLSINIPSGVTLQTGRYVVMTYTGSLGGSFGTPVNVGSGSVVSSGTLNIDTSVAGQVALVVNLTAGSITQSPTGTITSGATGVTYTISSVTGATSYNWAVPSGATITAGSGTTSITVTYGCGSTGLAIAADYTG